MRLLIINPGSTSTKLAVFEEEKVLVSENIQHPIEEIKAFPKIFDQYDYRLHFILEFLKANSLETDDFDAVVSRGGLVRPIPCGTYRINDEMIKDLREGVEGHHASNLGPALAKGIGDQAGIPSFIVDPITVDEMSEIAKITGIPEIRRESRIHTLNQKAVARKVAAELGGKYEEMNFVICHLGTGSSIGAHKRGRIVDMCDARGEGPMCGDRSGAVNSFLMAEMIYEKKLSHDDFIKKAYMGSGLVAHVGTKDIRQIHEMIKKGDQHAKLILDAMIYQVAKEVGAESAALDGEIDAIILTGGMVFDEYIVRELSRKISFIAPIILKPGEMEMEALALGGLRVLRGEEEAKEYSFSGRKSGSAEK